MYVCIYIVIVFCKDSGLPQSLKDTEKDQRKGFGDDWYQLKQTPKIYSL